MKDTTPASRKLAKREAKALLADASSLIVAKGRKVTRFKGDELSSSAAVDAMLGPTGNLRAPTIRAGKTLLVGFNQEVFDAFFQK